LSVITRSTDAASGEPGDTPAKEGNGGDALLVLKDLEYARRV
jgi:hypothetical protein